MTSDNLITEAVYFQLPIFIAEMKNKNRDEVKWCQIIAADYSNLLLFFDQIDAREENSFWGILRSLTYAARNKTYRLVGSSLYFLSSLKQALSTLEEWLQSLPHKSIKN